MKEETCQAKACAHEMLFSHTEGVSESKMVRDIKKKRLWVGAKVGGVRRWSLCSPMVAYPRIGTPLGSEIAGGETHCNGGVKVALGGRFAAMC